MTSYFNKRLLFKGKQAVSIQNKIAQIDTFKGFWQGKLSISPQILSRLKKSVIITSTGASTRIEGSSLSDKEVEKLLKGIKIKKLIDRDSQEIAGYAEVTALTFNEYKSLKLNPSTIKHLHSLQLRYSVKDQHHKGQYKVGSNAVIAKDEEGKQSVIFNPTAPYLTEKEMLELIEWTNSELKNKIYHPLLIISNFICEFLAIHPFQDGNGRLSRILSNLLLLQNGYHYIQYVSLEKIIENRKLDYYLALRKSQKNREQRKEKLFPWMNFFLDCLVQQTDQAKEIIERRNTQAGLSENQRKILELLHKSKTPLSIADILETTKLNRETIKKSLQRLAEMNLATNSGLGRGSKWQTLIDKSK